MRNGYSPNGKLRNKGVRQKREDNPLFPTIPKSVAPSCIRLPALFHTSFQQLVETAQEGVGRLWTSCGTAAENDRFGAISLPFAWVFLVGFLKMPLFHMGSQKGVEKLFVSLGKGKSASFSHKLWTRPWLVENEKFCIIPGGGRLNLVVKSCAIREKETKWPVFRVTFQNTFRINASVRMNVLARILCKNGC